jgi:hypothetical protein
MRRPREPQRCTWVLYIERSDAMWVRADLFKTTPQEWTMAYHAELFPNEWAFPTKRTIINWKD